MRKNKLRKWLLAMSAFVVMLICVGTVYTIVHAGSVTITDIDYEKLTLTVQATGGDSRIFFATSKTATTWDEIPGGLDENQKATMDISWVSSTKNYTIYLKGDKSTDPISVTLPKQNTKFKASLNTSTNTFNFLNLGTSKDVYWRKSTSTEWKEYSETEMANLLESFYLKGVSLVFRTGQVHGTSAASPGERTSKICTVKITKRASAPSVSLNYNTTTFSVKKTMEYKLSDAEEWIPITSTTLNLEDAASPVLYENNADRVVEEDETVGIDFRVKATTSKVASQTKTLEVPIQEDTSLYNVNLVYTGSTQLKILIEKTDEKDENGEYVRDEDGNIVTLEAASSSNPYEYTVVESGDELDIHTAKWTSITSETTTISSTVAPKGSAIYVRKKTINSKLPGRVRCLTENVAYIDAASLENDVEINKIQGVDIEETFAICVSNKDTEVNSITFGGSNAGFKASKPQEVNGKYVITITINDTAAIEKVDANLEKDLAAVISLSNTEEITRGVILHIHKAATLTAASYTTYKGYGFIGGNATDDSGDLTFEIALNKPDEDELAKAKDVTDITYNGRTITNKDGEKAYTTDYNSLYHTITLTIPKENVAWLGEDGYVTPNKYGTAYSLVVTLGNGETLDGVKLTVAYPVTVSSNSTSFGISKTSYEKYQAEVELANKLNSDGDDSNNVVVPTTYSDPEVTYTIQSDIWKMDSTYSVTNVTWNGRSVMKKVESNSGSFTVTVDLAQLVQAGENVNVAGTGSLNVTLTNYNGETIVVDYGYQITVAQ